MILLFRAKRGIFVLFLFTMKISLDKREMTTKAPPASLICYQQQLIAAAR